MPITGIEQPSIIQIDADLRLRKYDGIHDFALPWYQDGETVKLVDGLSAMIYDNARLAQMYRYLNHVGELYFIESRTQDGYLPIGDVTFSQEDMPIVIGNKQYRSKGIGKRVIGALIARAKELEYDIIQVKEIYSHNTSSKALFTSMGFSPCEETENGYRYHLDLMVCRAQCEDMIGGGFAYETTHPLR